MQRNVDWPGLSSFILDDQVIQGRFGTKKMMIVAHAKRVINGPQYDKAYRAYKASSVPGTSKTARNNSKGAQSTSTPLAYSNPDWIKWIANMNY